jgi:hypothetical protein
MHIRGHCAAPLLLTLALTAGALAEGVNLNGKSALDFSFEEVSFGRETSLADFDGRVVLLNFWYLD